GPLGWRELILKASGGGLDIGARDLKAALAKRCKVDRFVMGFDDFTGERGIEPGEPNRSLLYHALASPRVTSPGLRGYPTLAEIEAVENYVYGARPPSLADIERRAGKDTLAVVVFAVEYRPARDSVHGDQAQLCFSRTGIARMGDLPASYDAKARAFEPLDPAKPFSFRTIPQRFAAYLAVRTGGDASRFGPQDALANDDKRSFWVPLHKLYSGTECLKGVDLTVDLASHYRNEKLRKFHRYMRNQGFFTDWAGEDLDNFPFVIKDEMIGSLSKNPDYAQGVVEPRPAAFVNRARYKDQWLSFEVPGNWARTPGVLYFSSGQVLPGSDEIARIPEVPPAEEAAAAEGAEPTYDYMAGLAPDTDRNAPEYISVRHRLRADGTLEDLNARPDMMDFIRKGGYRAQHFIDFSGDGWVEARCQGLPDSYRIGVPAFSLISPPDFFPYVSQRELTRWWKTETPKQIRAALWAIPPYPLSQRRMAGDVNLPLGFDINDDTATAIVTQPRREPAPDEAHMPSLRVDDEPRYSGLPDNSPGVFDPGWDGSQGIFFSDPDVPLQRYLQNQGLGTPFVEDVKLCAALGSYWPAIAPDSTRSWTPLKKAPGELYPWPTIVPLTDQETGITAMPDGRIMPWDGVRGPQIVTREGKRVVRYTDIMRADYINLPGTMTASQLAQIDLAETKARVMAMEAVYWALGIRDPEYFAKYGDKDFMAAQAIVRAKSGWAVTSFRKVGDGDAELAVAEGAAGARLSGRRYAFHLYKPGEETPDPTDFHYVLLTMTEEVTAFAGDGKVLIRRGNGAWTLDASLPTS
ncbi:MAG: hypothetical protein ACXWVH_01630, partial [Caulobacteraceae bacterium]